MKKCAILLSGGINYSNNHERYKNDLELAYRVLKEVGGFLDNNIYLFLGNGAIGFENVNLITESAQKEIIINCLNKLTYDLEEEDELVFVVSNHGGNEDGGNICLWGKDNIKLSELAERLNNIKARKVIILGECFGGNMLMYDIVNSCIITANKPGKLSYAHLVLSNGNCLYDEFIYHFFSYMMARYPDTGNRIPQGCNHIEEAFKYAKENDMFNPNNPNGIEIITRNERIIEIPQIKMNLKDSGRSL